MGEQGRGQGNQTRDFQVQEASLESYYWSGVVRFNISRFKIATELKSIAQAQPTFEAFATFSSGTHPSYKSIPILSIINPASLPSISRLSTIPLMTFSEVEIIFSTFSNSLSNGYTSCNFEPFCLRPQQRSLSYSQDSSKASQDVRTDIRTEFYGQLININN